MYLVCQTRRVYLKAHDRVRVLLVTFVKNTVEQVIRQAIHLPGVSDHVFQCCTAGRRTARRIPHDVRQRL